MAYNSCVAFITILLVYIATFAIGNERFFVQDSVSQSGNYYWVNRTEIVIVCNPHNDARDISISEIDSSEESTSIVERKETKFPSNRNYSLYITTDGIYRLSIQYPVDLSQFQCKWYDPWVCGFLFCYGGSTEKHFVHLRVIESSGKHDDNCTLLNDLSLDGKPIYFAGDNITLSCSEDGLNVYFMEGTITLFVYQPVADEISEELYLLTIPNITSTFNGSKIYCNERGDTEDYCKTIPVIGVYEGMDVNVKASTYEVRNGDNVTITCRSNFHEHASFEWDISNNISFISSEIPGGVQLLITNIDLALSSYVAVVCNVTVGSKSSEANVTIYEYVDKRKGSPGNLLLSIFVPVALVLLIICVIVGIIFYRKSSNEVKGASATTDFGNEQHNSDTNRQASDVYHYVDGNKGVQFDEHGDPSGVEIKSENPSAYYYVDANDTAKLGLTPSDSEVANNVAYMPYDGNNSKYEYMLVKTVSD